MCIEDLRLRFGIPSPLTISYPGKSQCLCRSAREDANISTGAIDLGSERWVAARGERNQIVRGAVALACEHTRLHRLFLLVRTLPECKPL